MRPAPCAGKNTLPTVCGPSSWLCAFRVKRFFWGGLVVATAYGVLLGPAFADTAASHAHEHGAAQMTFVRDATELRLHFESPLDNLVGFEHAPRTPAHHEALSRMQARLNQPGVLFALPDEALCKPVHTEIKAPYLVQPELGPGSAPLASPTSEPVVPEKAHTHATTHADLSADWVFDCQNPQALTQLRVDLFEAFKGIRRIDVKGVSEKGQTAARLTPRSPVLRF
jgi:hypothetical protein